MVEKECMICAGERKRRAQVLLSPESAEAAQRYAAFAESPYVHPYNQPKYHALICHAWHYAKVHEKQLFWCLAQDWPLTMEDDQMDAEELQRSRETWLLFHDQKTNGVMGSFPLAQDMPLRFTDSVCAEKKIHRNTPGKLKGIILAPEEEASL